MKEFLETAVGRIILGAIVLVIWGVNAFNFSQRSSDENVTVSTINDVFNEVSIPQKASYVYSNVGKDPFVRPNEVQPVATEEFYEEEMEYRPDLVLNGIFGTTAMITINAMDVVFVEPGDVLGEGVLLKRIFTDSVHIEIGDELITLIINQ